MKAIQKSVSISMDPPPPLSWAEEAIIDRELELAAGGSSGEEEQSREHTVLAVACCSLITDGITTRFQCKFPDCGRDYASRDAVRKHCRIRHLQWCARPCTPAGCRHRRMGGRRSSFLPTPPSPGCVASSAPPRTRSS